MTALRIAIVGPGRLGRSLAQLLEAVGHRVSLHGRGEAPGEVEGVLLTVPDRVVSEVAQSLADPSPVVLHCAGALGIEVLEPLPRRGSFHPLMTFPGPEVAMPKVMGVPVAVAGHPAALAFGHRLARDLGMRAFEVPGDRRLYHAAAVIAGNLVTVLIDEAAGVLERAGVNRSEAFEVLRPLAERSLANAPLGLERALTGPIARGDLSTLEGHRRALQTHHPEARAVYDVLVDHAIARLRGGSSDTDDPKLSDVPDCDPEGGLS